MLLNHITIKKPSTLSVALQDAKEAKAVPQPIRTRNDNSYHHYGNKQPISSLSEKNMEYQEVPSLSDVVKYAKEEKSFHHLKNLREVLNQVRLIPKLTTQIRQTIFTKCFAWQQARQNNKKRDKQTLCNHVSQQSNRLAKSYP